MRTPLSTEVFSALYDEYMPKVFAYIRYKVDSDETTEDLTSTVFEKALTSFEKYSKDRAAFSTWIFTIARNTVIDHYRSGAHRHQVSLDEATEVVSDRPTPEEEAEKATEKECLLRCLATLPEQDRELIQLKFNAEMTNRQISRMLHLTESNVGVRLFRAVKKLRASFEEAWNG